MRNSFARTGAGSDLPGSLHDLQNDRRSRARATAREPVQACQDPCTAYKMTDGRAGARQQFVGPREPVQACQDPCTAYKMTDGAGQEENRRRSRWGDRSDDAEADGVKKKSRWGAKDAAPVQISGGASLLVQQNPDMIKVQLRLNEIQRLQALTRFHSNIDCRNRSFGAVSTITPCIDLVAFAYPLTLFLSWFFPHRNPPRSFCVNLCPAWKTAACMSATIPTRASG